MPDRKILIIAAVAILLGFALGRSEMCLDCAKDRHDGLKSGQIQPLPGHPQINAAPGVMPPQGGMPANMPNQGAAPSNLQPHPGVNAAGNTGMPGNESLELQNPPGQNSISGENQQPGIRPQPQIEPEATVQQAEAVAATIMAAMPELKPCYDAALKIAPDLTPNFEMRIFLKATAGQGKLLGLKSLNPTPLPPEALACFIGEISRLQFDLSQGRDGDECAVTVPLEFSAAP